MDRGGLDTYPLLVWLGVTEDEIHSPHLAQNRSKSKRISDSCYPYTELYDDDTWQEYKKESIFFTCRAEYIKQIHK